MSDLTQSEGFDDEGDLVLAEFVLGVLSRAERIEIARRVETDPETARSVAAWEARLDGLNDAYQEVRPPAAAFSRIESRLFPGAGASAAVPWYERLAVWRAAAVGATAVAIVSIGLQLVPFVAPAPERSLQVASLAAEEAGLTVMALFDPETASLQLAASGQSAPEGSDYELWAIPPEEAPISLGVFQTGSGDPRVVGADTAPRLVEGVSFAVSLEPSGGSTTGAPTGPVLAVAPITPI